MSEFEFKRGKGFKVDDTFFKDNFDITDIEDNIYHQMTKIIARNVDIELAKTPLVDILTGYTRYKEAEYELQQKENIIKEVREKLNTQLAFTSSYQLNYQSAMSIIEEAKSILDKENRL